MSQAQLPPPPQQPTTTAVHQSLVQLQLALLRAPRQQTVLGSGPDHDEVVKRLRAVLELVDKTVEEACPARPASTTAKDDDADKRARLEAFAGKLISRQPT